MSTSEITPESCVRTLYYMHFDGSPSAIDIQMAVEQYRDACREQRYGSEGMSDQELESRCWREVVLYGARTHAWDTKILDVYSEVFDVGYDMEEAYLSYHREPLVPFDEYMGEVTKESRFVQIPECFTPHDVADALDTVRRGANTMIVGPESRMFNIVDVGERGVEMYRLDEVTP